MADSTAEQLVLFDIGGVDMRVLKIRAAALVGNSAATATVRAYDADWRIFAGWCKAAGRDLLPASSETVMLFAVSELQTRKPSTVERRLAAIVHMHRAHKLPKPVSEEIRQVLHGWRREHGSKVASKKALTPTHLRAMVAQCATTATGGRDRAILTLGFATGLRRSDLSALDYKDITFAAQGLRVFIRRSKTDQLGRGREIGVFPGKKANSDPVRWLLRYIEQRGRWAGPLFVSARRSHPGELGRERLTGDGVGDLVKRMAGAIGLEASDFGAHSLRAGCVTAAIELGVPESLVMQLTGHRSHQTLSKYVRPSKVFSIDVLAGAL